MIINCFIMNIVSWNVRGLGRPSKRFLIKDFLNLHFADVCCLQESKLEAISPIIWREIGGGRLDQFEFLPARGSAGGIIVSGGGIIVGWNSVLFTGKLERMNTFSLTIEFVSKKDNFIWRCTTVYGPNARSLKVAFWEELRECASATNVPWIVCGDFNAIFSLEDKSSGAPNLEDVRQANALMFDLSLLEPRQSAASLLGLTGR